ncbi:hypothetical protein BDV96DRAFT_586196 [Lophiotrema nucula]|uniref:Uncharacterized protein n=1 Tax=Lophiotrema nucula TaxID=690887 RepID=A0A6A5YQE9_9PLEO|nr:hypothetical protein BDV96DRAFT_586196 [Lophiotrema nucula]
MSGPSSEGPPSVSSEPSTASSPTLNSRYSGLYDDHGEGSSSQRSSLVSSREPGRIDGLGELGGGIHESQSHGPLRGDSIEEHDFAQRRQRNRRSGGFLLDSTFPTGPKTRQQARASTLVGGAKEKRSSRYDLGRDAGKRHSRLRAANDGMPSSSPLSRQLAVGDDSMDEDASGAQPRGPGERSDGGIHVAKTRKIRPDVSPAPQAIDIDDDRDAPRPTIDPNQIVHMALNLSESRRRNLSAGQLLLPQSTGSRRVASVGVTQDGSFRNYGSGSSLRQYLNEQRRISRNVSPGAGRSTPSGLRQVSMAIPRSGSMSLQGSQFVPSEATLARRDKARMYIELRMEYLRLLDHLPPLKPDSSAPGNFIVSASNVPGSPIPQLTRMPSYAGKVYDLGRAYNPLQYIRNRRSRARERRALDHQPEEFADVDAVKDWVDKIEKAARNAQYRQFDSVALPKFHEDHEGTTAPTKPARPRMGWVFTSEELLADAHWLEQGDNKAIIEDRHGRKVFPPKESPQRLDLLAPRESTEYSEKRRRSWVEGLAGFSETGTGDESEAASDRGRKRRLLPAFRAESPNKKHRRRGSKLRTASYTDDSGSDSDAPKGKHRRTSLDVNNNTGPLARHLKQLMEKQAGESDPRSPAIVSPDTPDKWGAGHSAVPEHDIPRSSVDSARVPNGFAIAEANIALKVPPKKRHANQIVSEENTGEPRSSFEDSTAPNTPVRSRRFPHFGVDLSPPPSRGTSVTRKPKKIKDMFRSDESAKSHRADIDSAGSDSKRASRHVSEEAAEANGFSTAILAAPSAVKSLLTHKKNDSVSSLPSPDHWHRKDTKESKDPSSAVTRFFKGVKSEGSKVGEFIFRRDRPAEESDSETISDTGSLIASDTEGDGLQRRKPRPDLLRSATATTAASVASKKSHRYHMDLPSFRSSNLNEDDKALSPDSQFDHITRQAVARANDRSPRFDKLAPPRMDLRHISTNSTTSVNESRAPSTSSDRDRLSKVLAKPGGVGLGGNPVTSLAHPSRVGSTSRGRSTSSRPTLEKRQWSITDGTGTGLYRKITPSVITNSDIARIRALFLCSGVKAKVIASRATAIRKTTPAFLTKAAKTANTELVPVPRKEEHVLAARMLVSTLEASTKSLHASAEGFRESTVKELHSAINALKATVEADLFPKVRNSGDEAMRITNEVSGQAPLTVKQVSDEIDRMIRMRRRRMRWARRVGWMLVEWLLVGVMWWLWFIVVILSTVKRFFGFGWSVVRWLLWI